MYVMNYTVTIGTGASKCTNTNYNNGNNWKTGVAITAKKCEPTIITQFIKTIADSACYQCSWKVWNEESSS